MITRLLVNKLNLPEAILNQWRQFEHSQFVIQIRCTMFVLPPRPFFFGLIPSRRASCEKPNLYDLAEYNRSSVLVCTHNSEHSFCRACRCPIVFGRGHGPCGDLALESLSKERTWVRCPKPSKFTLIPAPLWLHFMPSLSDCGIMVEEGIYSQDYVNCRCGA